MLSQRLLPREIKTTAIDILETVMLSIEANYNFWFSRANIN